jgi:hypothetical protein
LNHRADTKFLPKRSTERALEGLPGIALSRRERPQSPQKPVRRATHQEERAVRTPEQRGHDIVMGEDLLRALRRDRILEATEAG